MKTLSTRFWFVVFGVIVIVAVGSCCLPFIPDIASYSVEIGNKQKGLEYVPWKNQGKFDRALKQVCDNHGTYCIYVKLQDRDPDPIHPYRPSNPPSNCTDCRLEKIRTVKVTKSKAADNTANVQSAVNDPNVMHRVQSPDPGDIKQVLDALEK